ncbi:hypothetical protein J6590_007872 [Homalodisca vitripennis]|nr:hypothetical protein J6590_007872 [Homalodisca vitripennis]
MSNSSDEIEKALTKKSSKKRKAHGRMSSVSKENRANEQTSYLTSLISVNLIVRRRPRKDDINYVRDCSFRYIVRVKRYNTIREINVCQKAFISLHGITKRRLKTIQTSMKNTGGNTRRPWRLSKDKTAAIENHIGSFRGRASHYGKGRSDRIYLPEELSITKSRQHSCPFKVVPVEQNIIRDWTKFLKDRYKPKCQFKTRPIREALVNKEDNMFQYRNSFNGAWTTGNLNHYPNEINDLDHQFQPQAKNKFFWPDPAYNGKLYFQKNV